jgi:gas vesicle protein
MAYMAIISNSDLYNDMKTRGLTNSEAASIALGSTLGMFGLNKYTKLGEIFFDDATDDAVKLARTAIKNEMSEAMTMFNAIKNSNISTSNKILQFIKTASDKTSNVLSKFSEDVKHHSLGFLGKAVGEGLEEVGEELISDTAKSIYELAG